MQLSINYKEWEYHISLVENERKEIMHLKECLEHSIIYNQDNPMFNNLSAHQAIESLDILERKVEFKLKFLKEALDEYMLIKNEIIELWDR